MEFLNNVKIDLSTTVGVKNPTPNNNSILTKEQIDAAIVANSPTTVSYEIKDGIYDSGSGIAATINGETDFTVGYGVMAFDSVTVNGVAMTPFKIYRCVTAGTILTAVFAEIAVKQDETITTTATIQYPGTPAFTLFGGYIYSYDGGSSGFDVWIEGDLLLSNAVIVSSVDVPISVSGTYPFPLVFPIGARPSKIEVFFLETPNGTVGTGSISVGTAAAPSSIMANTDIQSSAAFNLQNFAANGYWSKEIRKNPFTENTVPIVTITAPTGATAGLFTFRLSTY
jgi:hypothetical protein